MQNSLEEAAGDAVCSLGVNPEMASSSRDLIKVDERTELIEWIMCERCEDWEITETCFFLCENCCKCNRKLRKQFREEQNRFDAGSRVST